MNTDDSIEINRLTALVLEIASTIPEPALTDEQKAGLSDALKGCIYRREFFILLRGVALQLEFEFSTDELLFITANTICENARNG